MKDAAVGNPGGYNNLPVYDDELEGQVDFFRTYLPRIDSTLDISDIQNDYSDGVVRGNIIEFKLDFKNLNETLFQAIKYLSLMRIKGKSVPANILLVYLNQHVAYQYHSEDYLNEIETVYSGPASTDNKKFVGKDFVAKYEYAYEYDEEKMIGVLKEERFTKIHIDENCVVGWGHRYYKENPSARKGDFIGDKTGKVQIPGEIRRPDKFKDFIYPYDGDSNERFRYLLDKLNDPIAQKNLGAFFTPDLYAEKSLELVRKAIARVPNGNDFIILDRCAGTGNLEQFMTAEELSHVIVSTLEYYEYKVLWELFSDKVRHIIPPTERSDTFNMGMVRGADALSREYIENKIIRQYVDKPECTIILFENPPYAETTSLEHQRQGKAKESSAWKKSYVVKEMKKEVKGKAVNDLGNAFIWSGFKYYLRQPTDSYIVYSPVKYWKAQHLIDKKFLGGFAFNRRHFHTQIDACIMVALWGGENAANEELVLEGYNIGKDNKLDKPVRVPVKKIYSWFSQKYYEQPPKFHESSCDGILIGLNGLEIKARDKAKQLYSDEMLGYLVAHSSGFDNPDAKSSLLVACRYDGHGFYLRKDNYLEKLPMFAATRYIRYNNGWTERGRIMKSGDGADRFNRDVKSGKLRPFLLKCLLFTVLEPQNHMRSFTGSDRRDYRNELCLDTTNGETIASRDLAKMKMNDRETKMLGQWKKILQEARKTDNYNPKLTYGLYQIKVELNTFHIDEATGNNVPDYMELDTAIGTLADLVKEYYTKRLFQPFSSTNC